VFENLIGKECCVNYATFGEISYDVVGIVKSIADDFMLIETKKDIQYIALKAIIRIIFKK
jgi:hypothetical protein